MAGTPIADGPGDGGVLADGSAYTEIKRVHHPALVLDLLAFHPDVGDPVLAAAIGAAGHVQLELLIEAGQPLFQFVDNPAGEALGLGDGELAEFGAGAGDRAAPEGGALHRQAERLKLAGQFLALLLGILMTSRFCMTVVRSWPSP